MTCFVVAIEHESACAQGGVLSSRNAFFHSTTQGADLTRSSDSTISRDIRVGGLRAHTAKPVRMKTEINSRLCIIVCLVESLFLLIHFGFLRMTEDTKLVRPAIFPTGRMDQTPRNIKLDVGIMEAYKLRMSRP